MAGEGLVRVHGGRAVTIGEAAKWGTFAGCRDPKGGIWWVAVGGIFHLSNGHFLLIAPIVVKTDNSKRPNRLKIGQAPFGRQWRVLVFLSE